MHFQASTAKFAHYHKWHQYDKQRLGQRFVNLYIKHHAELEDPENPGWPELFYQINDDHALRMIDKWLTDHHYIDNLPSPLDVEKVPHYPDYLLTEVLVA